jgi:dipeptidyl aminopeptidase/acylaminoacyl peptidase
MSKFPANCRLRLAAAWAVIWLFVATSPVGAQRRDFSGGAGVHKARISPNWFDNSARFWYQNDLAQGKREFVLIDAREGARKRAFDHDKLAAALREHGIADAQADRLPIEALNFKLADHALDFRASNRDWRLNLVSYGLTEVKNDKPSSSDAKTTSLRGDAPRRSRRTGGETEITLINRTGEEVEIFWLDPDGQRQSYGKLAAGEQKAQHTFAGHVWEAVGRLGRTLATFEAEETAATAIIDGRSPQPNPRPLVGGGARRDDSPDGKWTAQIKNHNVVLRPKGSDKEIQLTDDGREGLEYRMLEWSPDSTSLVAFRVEPAEREIVHLIESSPRGGGRAVLHSRGYDLPGDKFTTYNLRLFDVVEQKTVPCHVEPIDFGTPRIRWNKDGHTFTYQKTDRGHQRLRLIEVDAHTGASRNLIDEQTRTFIWTAHMEGFNFRLINWLNNSDELIYVSERDGWRHLYLIDAKEGAIRNQITKGNYVVRAIDRIDEEKRQIWFRASGRNPDQDPYFLHYYRINFDGTGLVALTAGNGTHTVQYSPNEEFLIDTYSRVDQPPLHELRRTSDGQLVCALEEADIAELKSSGWQAPEVFSAKGRDGTTDIWGIICRPRDFDPAKKYPVIEQIYAGPQGSFVPKAFSAQRRFAALADLGFVVVQMDGMGTANRSKAFHDVCWHNLKDAGLPDRILWHQAVAAKYPWYDITRVGIYGTSAGGQNSTGALLFHPEFYKVGVSACGCHDNRMDKASWNEQWMGHPVGPQYSESSNIDNAARLRGKLMLIVGEMDTNVPPESTFRLADALIKAGKDFDLVVVPGANHGIGGAYGTRRMHDFFVRNLLGAQPPDRNAAP